MNLQDRISCRPAYLSAGVKPVKVMFNQKSTCSEKVIKKTLNAPSIHYLQVRPFELADDSKTNHIPDSMLISIRNNND